MASRGEYIIFSEFEVPMILHKEMIQSPTGQDPGLEAPLLTRVLYIFNENKLPVFNKNILWEMAWASSILRI